MFRGWVGLQERITYLEEANSQREGLLDKNFQLEEVVESLRSENLGLKANTEEAVKAGMEISGASSSLLWTMKTFRPSLLTLGLNSISQIYVDDGPANGTGSGACMRLVTTE
ncbi:Uncharacterized protein Fot_42001 [Forsythia ovata]|uniref:Uncharacterized protein n=1 Tax=Forsythia ovata TaxID=205694 RepID=A0ABD1RNR2_9LAMI